VLLLFTFIHGKSVKQLALFPLMVEQPCVVHKVKNTSVGSQHSKDDVLWSIALS